MLATGNFRDDLYYRLAVIPLHLPPLRARCADIPLLIRYFCKKHGGQEVTFHNDALDALTTYAWPGNVRELENIVERLLIMRSGDMVSLGDIPDKMQHKKVQRSRSAVFTLPDEGYSLEQLEREVVLNALERNEWNQTAAARFLRIPRHTIIYRLEKYGITLPEKKVS